MTIDEIRRTYWRFRDVPVSRPKHRHLSSSTYLSSIKCQLEDSTRTDFFEHHKQWYGRLHIGLRGRYVDKCNDEGVPLQAKAPLMTLQGLRLLTVAHFNTCSRKSLKDLTLLFPQWSVVGRSSDVGTQAFTDLQWVSSASCCE